MGSRDDGFAVADVSTSYYDDDKVRELWRILEGDVSAMCEAMTMHNATVIGSWRVGRRVTVNQAAPLWLPVREPIVEALVSARLLDRSRKVPPRSWAGWFGPAEARREERREAGRRGGIAKAKRTASSATAELYPTGRQAGPSVKPTDLPRARARGGAARRGNGPANLGEALAGTPLGEAIAARRTTHDDD